MGKHLSEDERQVLRLVRGTDRFILISEDKEGNFRIHQRAGDRDRFIFIYEPAGSGAVKLNAYGYPSDKVIAHRLTAILGDLFKKNHGLPETLEGKKLVLGPDGRIHESFDPVSEKD